MNSIVSALSARRETAGIHRRWAWGIGLQSIAVVVIMAQTLNPANRVVVELGTLALGAVTSAAFVAATLFARDGRERTSWACLAAGQICLAVGQVSGVLAPNHRHSYDMVTVALYVGFYATAALGLLMKPLRSLSQVEQQRFRLDIATASISSSLVYGILVFNDSQMHSSTQISSLLLNPTLNLILVWVFVVVLLRQDVMPLWQAAYGCGILFFTFADGMSLATHFGLIARSNFNGAIMLLHFVSDFSMLAAALLHCFRIDFPMQRLRRALAGRSVKRRFASLMTEFVLPYGWTIVAMGLILLEYGYYGRSMQPGELFFVAIGSIAVVALSLTRRWLMMQENAELMQRQVCVLQAARVLAQPMDLRSVPACILEQAVNLIPYDEAHIVLAREGDEAVVKSSGIGAAALGAGAAVRLRLDAAALTQLNGIVVLSAESPMEASARTDAATHVLTATRRTAWGDAAPVERRDWIVAPLMADHKSIGVLMIGAKAGKWNPHHHLSILDSFLQQAAAAVVNAWLRQQYSDAAASAERSRLSRELHDSVLQAIFGCSLGLRTAQHYVDAANTSAHDALAYSLRLVEGAISEMRALIFELRPETLVNEGLLVALQKQAQSLCDRHSILATVNCVSGEPALTDPTKESLYRIAIEALQNVIKHAHARHVQIELHESMQRVCMVINDDGVGFDTAGDFRGHLGLARMHERAAQVGAALVLTSAPNSGTRLEVCMGTRRG